MFATPGFQTVGTILAWYTASVRYPKLVQNPNIPNPCKSLFLIVVVSVNLMILSNFIVFNIQEMQKPVDIVLCLFYPDGFGILSCAPLSLALVRMSKSEQLMQTQYLQPYIWIYRIGADILAEFRSVKKFISPIVFITFVSQCLVSIAFS